MTSANVSVHPESSTVLLPTTDVKVIARNSDLSNGTTGGQPGYKTVPSSPASFVQPVRII